ncbi:MAG: hypothetical protein EZS28_034267, partial [Streblomastix strix]
AEDCRRISIFNTTLRTRELAKLGIPERDLATFTHHSKNSRTVQQYYIFASSIRANETARQGNELLSPYLLISPLAYPKYVSQPEVKQKQREYSLEN